MKSSVHLAIIILNQNISRYHRELFEDLRCENIGVQLHYSPVHLQPYYRNLGFNEGSYPAAENYAERAMSIPIFPGLKVKDQKRVIDILTSLLKTKYNC